MLPITAARQLPKQLQMFLRLPLVSDGVVTGVTLTTARQFGARLGVTLPVASSAV